MNNEVPVYILNIFVHMTGRQKGHSYTTPVVWAHYNTSAKPRFWESKSTKLDYLSNQGGAIFTIVIVIVTIHALRYTGASLSATGKYCGLCRNTKCTIIVIPHTKKS